MREIHNGEHAKDQGKTDGQQRVNRAQRNAGHQLQRKQLWRDIKHAVSSGG